MHFVKLLSVILCVLSISSYVFAQDAGIACYPGDCCAQYRQFVGSTFYPAQDTAPGTVCKAGQIVHARECSTPCSSVPTTPAPTQKATPAPTVRPTTAPTQRPPTQPTERPVSTQAPTQAPTKAPTQAPTKAPTQAPTKAPTQAPTKAPTQAPTQAPTKAPTQPPSTGKCNLADVFTESDYNALFPHANGAAINGLENQHAIFNYTYLLDAAKRFPEFACQGDVATRKREVAAFLAHTSQETSGWWAGQPYNWGYYFSTEVGCTNTGCTMYCERYNTEYPCAAGKGYFGRGPIQLSWNYNYGQVSKFLYGNDILLQNPDMMFDERGTAFTTALWFWMTPQNPKPSCHDVMTGKWVPNQLDINAGRKPGFGMTTNVINGGLECGYTTPQKVLNRIGYYTTYTNYLGVSAGDNLECSKMHSY
jgi:hypothetical protein